ncbi:MAG: cobalamin biosynthesis protein [Euryarchaeota archaeon]|nr:cobalamin biosynthesis protein [Euryarchaeota archaeon]
MAVEIDAPRNMLAAHPETAYFWGRVAGNGELENDCVTVRTRDETAARRLAAIAGAQQVDHRIVEREFAHDTALTRGKEEYTVQVFGDLADRASAALGLPIDGQPGGYRFDTFAEFDRQLLRGLLEGCGVVCFRESAGEVGISFVHNDERLHRRIQRLLDAAEPAVEYGALEESSSGGYWFGIDSTTEIAAWLYEGSEQSGLFSPSRRRKTLRSVERATGREVGALRAADRESKR